MLERERKRDQIGSRKTKDVTKREKTERHIRRGLVVTVADSRSAM